MTEPLKGVMQVSSARQQLAEGASKQAASIEDTSSMEEMSSMTRQNADNASRANTLMKEAKQIVGSANESMNGLSRSPAPKTRSPSRW